MENILQVLKGQGDLLFKLLLTVLFFYTFYSGCQLIPSSKDLVLSKDSVPKGSTYEKKIVTSVDSIGKKAKSQIITSDETTTTNPLQIPTQQSLDKYKTDFSNAIILFLISLGVLILLFLAPRISTLSIGPSGVNLTLQQVQSDYNASIENSNTAGGKTSNITGMSPVVASIAEKAVKSADADEDPQKGKWGGKSEVSGRRLSATVIPHPILPSLYNVYLKVESTSLINPLTGKVNFHLHPTFHNPNPTIYVINGVAKLKLTAWGSFTVGAETDDSKVKLELDLAEIPGVSQKFIET